MAATDEVTLDGQNTIFALSSGAGRAGVAVVRVSGPAASRTIEALSGRLPQPRSAAFRRLKTRDGDILDEALVLWIPGPKSETGEDMVEFHVHGSRAVVAALYRELGAIDGCRLAEPGEFVRRAFTNGKLDLNGVEGLADLIDAETEGQRRQAIRQASGELDRLYRHWRSDLVDCMGLVEAAIDFSDEGDVAHSAVEDARARARVLLTAIDAHLALAHRGEIVREGFRVALVGAPNVGKSSLLNALAARDVAIVSDEPGTTRDVIEVRLDLGGLPVVIADTAGLRDGGGTVEREGMRRTLERAAAADLVLWVVDATSDEGRSPVAGEGFDRPSVTVVNKCDLRPGGSGRSVEGDLLVSALTGEGLDRLVAHIGARAAEAAGAGGGDLGPTNERQRLLLAKARRHVASFIAGGIGAIELEAEALRCAAGALGRLTGRIDPEDVLGAVFGRFCIGK